MILIAIIAAFFSISEIFELPKFTSEHSQFFHHICLQSLPLTVENLGSLEALACGKSMHDLQLKELLTQSSLIHIFIVSGSHFLFLHKILARLPIFRRAPLIPLMLYALVTLCQPPALRSLIFLSLHPVIAQKKLFTPTVLLVILSGALCLCLFPQWQSSRSLVMSLLAALVLAVAGELFSQNRHGLGALFATQGALSIVMGFCLWGYGSLHPLGLLCNLLLGPLIGGLLFPLGLAVIFFPFLGFLFDAVLETLRWILEKISPLISGSLTGSSPLATETLWLLFLGLALSSFIFLIHHKRQRAARV